MRCGLSVLLISALFAAPAAAGERLEGKIIADTFRGMTLDGIYEDGAFFTETYRDDGSIRYHDGKGSDSGEWSVSGDTFCTFYEAQSGACFFVVRDGRNCFTFYEAVEEGGKLRPSPDWTSRGWDRAHHATCPTPPEVEV